MATPLGVRSSSAMLFAMAALVACESGSYDVRIEFDPEDLAAAATSVEVALIPSCDDQQLGQPTDAALATVVLRPMTVAGPLGELPPGDHGLYARALSSGCLAVAAGCTPVTLEAGGSGELLVTLTAVGGSGCPDGTTCSGDTCVPAMDGGTGCATCDDDNPCTDDTCSGDTCENVPNDANACTDGTCHAGDCCTGCWDGSACQTGDTGAACGASGGACAPCVDTDDCTDDGCSGGACAFTTRDADGDGHGDPACPEAGGVPADDCDEMTPTTYPGAPEGCNGVDDDCDMVLDEELSCVPGATQSCMTSCGSTGMQRCDATCLFELCMAPAESCNSMDDDCDSNVDEGFDCVPSSSEACTSSCGTTGTRTCRSTCRWRPCSPPAETCNGSDDDCDSSSDEDFACVQGATGSCSPGCGESGTRMCGSGCVWGTCTLTPPASTLALYTFDGEASRRAFTDSVGTHDGTIAGGDITWGSGPMGCGMAFSIPGTGDIYGVIPDSPDWDLAVGSIEFWVRTNTRGAEDGLIGRDAFGTTLPGHLKILRAADGRIFARIQTSSGNAVRCTASPIPDGTWARVLVRWGPPDFELRVDGVVATGASTSSGSCSGSTTGGIAGNDNPWVIGADPGASAEGSATPLNDYFNGGSIDHIRIRNVR